MPILTQELNLPKEQDKMKADINKINKDKFVFVSEEEKERVDARPSLTYCFRADAKSGI